VAVGTKLITYEDSRLMPENKREEIIRGEIRPMPPPSLRHAFVTEALSEQLKAQVDRRFIRVITSSFGQGIRRDPLHYRVPDLAVHNLEGLRADHYVWSTPELIVECLSPSNRKDSIENLLEDYALISAPEVWFVNVDARTLSSYVLQSGRHTLDMETSSGTVSPRRLPLVSISLPELWAALQLPA
jgi:Uma2 family endonuclease